MATRIQDIARYVSNNKKQCILSTKPPIFVATFAKELKNDTFQILNQAYCKMTNTENALLPKRLHNSVVGKAFADVIPKIEGKEFEKGYIFDTKGKYLAETHSKSRTNAYWKDKDWAKICDLTDKGVRTAFIHNHPCTGTFSGPDLNSFVMFNSKFMIAKTPNGYAYLERNMPFSDKEKALIALAVKNDTKATILLSKTCNSNLEIMQKLDEFRNEQLKRLAKLTSSTYKYKVGCPISDCSKNVIPDFKNIFIKNLKKEYLKANYSQDEIDVIMNKIYETPLEKFYISSVDL